MPQGGTWHWIVLIAAAPRQPHTRLPDAHWLSEGRRHTCGPRGQHRRTVINMSSVNILDICASFHLQIPQCGVTRYPGGQPRLPPPLDQRESQRHGDFRGMGPAPPSGALRAPPPTSNRKSRLEPGWSLAGAWLWFRAPGAGSGKAEGWSALGGGSD